MWHAYTGDLAEEFQALDKFIARENILKGFMWERFLQHCPVHYWQ